MNPEQPSPATTPESLTLDRLLRAHAPFPSDARIGALAPRTVVRAVAEGRVRVDVYDVTPRTVVFSATPDGIRFACTCSSRGKTTCVHVAAAAGVVDHDPDLRATIPARGPVSWDAALVVGIPKPSPDWRGPFRDPVPQPSKTGSRGWGRSVGPVYILTREEGDAVVALARRAGIRGGESEAFTSTTVAQYETSRYSDPDRSMLRVLAAESGNDGDPYFDFGLRMRGEDVGTRYVVGAATLDWFIRRAAPTGRLYAQAWNTESVVGPCSFEEGPTFRVTYVVRKKEGSSNFIVTAELRRGEERVELNLVALVLPAGFLVHRTRIYSLAPNGLGLCERVAESPIEVPGDEMGEVIERLWAAADLTSVDLPPEFDFQVTPLTPTPRLVIRRTPDDRPGFFLFRRPALRLRNMERRSRSAVGGARRRREQGPHSSRPRGRDGTHGPVVPVSRRQDLG